MATIKSSLWDDDMTLTFFRDLGLESFYHERKRKQPGSQLEPYLRSPKLGGYSVLGPDLTVLEPQGTYIRYIRTRDLHSDNDYNSHIRTGGILVAGGYYENNAFVPTDQKSEWSMLQLMFKMVAQDEKGYWYELKEEPPRIYCININRYQIFYKRFRRKGQLFDRRDMENIQIELV